MRICKTLFCLLFIVTFFPKPMAAMEDPDENTLLAALVNKLNKLVDPVGYATNNKAIKAYHDALSYDPAQSKINPLSLDDRSKKVIIKIIPRMMASRTILRKIVESKNPDHPDIRAMSQAKKDMPGFFSECDDAILLGLLSWKRHTHKRQLEDYEAYVEDLAQQKSLFVSPEAKDKQPKLEISVADLKALALKQFNWWNPLQIAAEALHYVSKHYVFPIDHLTNSDSRDLCTGMLYFNPMHPNHNVDPELILDPEKDWHRWLVRKVTDREEIFLSKLYVSLLMKKPQPQQVMRLSRPKIETPNSTIPFGIFTQVTDSLSSGFLAFSRAKQLDNLPDEPRALEEKQKQAEAQKKAAEEAAKKKLEEEQLKALKSAEEQKIKEEALRKKIEDEITQRLADKAEKEKADMAARAASDKTEHEENKFVLNLLPQPLPNPPAKPTIKLGSQPQP